MNQYERLGAISAQNGGILRTADARAQGICKSTLAKYVAANGYERVSLGIYLAPDAWEDSMYILGLRCPQIVFSHESALALHDLTDRQPPLQLSVTVKNGYNPSRLTADGVKVYTVKRELYGLGVSTGTTWFGHQVAVYDLERTICDIIRSRRTVETQSYLSALKRYVHRRDKDLSRLNEYAKVFRVEKSLRQYMEVLLSS